MVIILCIKLIKHKHTQPTQKEKAPRVIGVNLTFDLQVQVHSSGIMLGRVSYLKEYPPSDVVVILRDLMLPGTGAQH